MLGTGNGLLAPEVIPQHTYKFNRGNKHNSNQLYFNKQMQIKRHVMPTRTSWVEFLKISKNIPTQCWEPGGEGMGRWVSLDSFSGGFVHVVRVALVAAMQRPEKGIGHSKCGRCVASLSFPFK